jgi:hypothetical protein
LQEDIATDEDLSCYNSGDSHHPSWGARETPPPSAPRAPAMAPPLAMQSLQLRSCERAGVSSSSATASGLHYGTSHLNSLPSSPARSSGAMPWLRWSSAASEAPAALDIRSSAAPSLPPGSLRRHLEGVGMACEPLVTPSASSAPAPVRRVPSLEGLGLASSTFCASSAGYAQKGLESYGVGSTASCCQRAARTPPADPSSGFLLRLPPNGSTSPPPLPPPPSVPEASVAPAPAPVVSVPEAILVAPKSVAAEESMAYPTPRATQTLASPHDGDAQSRDVHARRSAAAQDSPQRKALHAHVGRGVGEQVRAPPPSPKPEVPGDSSADLSAWIREEHVSQSAAMENGRLQDIRTELIGTEYGSFMETTGGADARAQTTGTGGQDGIARAADPGMAGARMLSQRTQTLPIAGIDRATQTDAAFVHGRRRKQTQDAQDRYERAMRLIRKTARRQRRRAARGSAFLVRAAALGTPTATAHA